MRRAMFTTAIAASLLLAACSGDDGDSAGTAEPTAAETATVTAGADVPAVSTNEPRPTPTFPPVADPVPVTVVPAYETVVLDRPIEVLSYPLGGYEIALAEQGGVIFGVREGEAFELIDLSDRILAIANEEGLLSVALDPQFSTNSHIWIYYSADEPRRTVVSRFAANPDGSIDPGSELVVLEQEQPYPNHNGGALRFGPDRMLYLGLGDGGDAGDPQGHSQNPETLLGSIIRIDVSRASTAEPYRIPDDNPFVGQEGVRPETFAYGLRNPWRMAFDSAEGHLWVGDVGQNEVEEVDRVQAGDNLGWNVMEGDQCYQGDCDPSLYTAPIATYANAGGRCSITGGVVARRAGATAVEGSYIFGDYCSGELWALRSDSDGSAEPMVIARGLGSISSISQVGNQIYILVFGEPMYRLVDQ